MLKNEGDSRAIMGHAKKNDKREVVFVVESK